MFKAIAAHQKKTLTVPDFDVSFEAEDPYTESLPTINDDVLDIERHEMFVDLLKTTKPTKDTWLMLSEYSYKTAVSIEALRTSMTDIDHDIATEGFFGDLKDKIVEFTSMLVSKFTNFFTWAYQKVRSLFTKVETASTDFASASSKVSDGDVQEDRTEFTATPASIVLKELKRFASFVLVYPAKVAAFKIGELIVDYRSIRIASGATDLHMHVTMSKDLLQSTFKDTFNYYWAMDFAKGTANTIVDIEHRVPGTMSTLGFTKEALKTMFSTIRSIEYGKILTSSLKNIVPLASSAGRGFVSALSIYGRLLHHVWTRPIYGLVLAISAILTAVSIFKKLAKASS